MNEAQLVRADEKPLIERLRRSDSRAWRDVFSLYRDRIFRLCFRMLRNPTESEDAASEVFERAVRSIGGFRGDSSLNTWLFRIATNVCLTRIEQRRRERGEIRTERAPDEEQNPPAGEIGTDEEKVGLAEEFGSRQGKSRKQGEISSEDMPADEVAYENQLQRALARALDELDPTFRCALHLREVEQRSYEEIADLMGIPIETVKTRIHRGRRKLQQYLADFHP